MTSSSSSVLSPRHTRRRVRFVLGSLALRRLGALSLKRRDQAAVVCIEESHHPIITYSRERVLVPETHTLLPNRITLALPSFAPFRLLPLSQLTTLCRTRPFPSCLLPHPTILSPAVCNNQGNQSVKISRRNRRTTTNNRIYPIQLRRDVERDCF